MRVDEQTDEMCVVPSIIYYTPEVHAALVHYLASLDMSFLPSSTLQVHVLVP